MHQGFHEIVPDLHDMSHDDLYGVGNLCNELDTDRCFPEIMEISFKIMVAKNNSQTVGRPHLAFIDSLILT